MPSAARSGRPTAISPSCASSPARIASGQSSSRVTAVMPMKCIDSPDAKSRRTSQSRNSTTTVPNSRCWRRRSLNSSIQGARAAAQSNTGR